MALIDMDFMNGGGGTQYKKGNITIASTGTTVNCGFKPKKVFIAEVTLASGTYYGGMMIYDEDNDNNGYVYAIASGSADFSEYFASADARITVSDSGFTVLPQNSVWNDKKAYYYAMED